MEFIIRFDLNEKSSRQLAALAKVLKSTPEKQLKEIMDRILAVDIEAEYDFFVPMSERIEKA